MLIPDSQILMSTLMLAMFTWVAWRIRIGPCAPLPAHLIDKKAAYKDDAPT